MSTIFLPGSVDDVKHTETNRPRLALLTAPGVPEPHNLAAIRERADVVMAHADTLADALRGADAVLLWDFFSSALRDAWHAADSLQWVHVAAAGVDAMLFDGLRESPVALTNAHGTFSQPIAEFCLLYTSPSPRD